MHRGYVYVQGHTCCHGLRACRKTHICVQGLCRLAGTHICTCVAQSLSLSLSRGCLCPGVALSWGFTFLGGAQSIPVPTEMLCRSRSVWNVGGCSLPSSLAGTWDPWQRPWPLAHKVGAVGRVVLVDIDGGMDIGLGGG